MALNGLDAAKVREAYQTAQDEAGGWFLLKYTSRDEVDLLARGNGGFSDASESLADYSEKSPLYAFLLYRRRKLLIKYIPEGTSRLLQARTAVHFQTVQETFTHDAILNATSPSDLNESALSACCSLHTSVKSSSSSAHRQNLDGISESAEETSTLRGGGTASKAHSVATTTENGRPSVPDEQALNKSLPELPQELDSPGLPRSNTQTPLTEPDSLASDYKGSLHDRDTSDLVSESTGSRNPSRAESARKYSDIYSKPRPSTSELLKSGLDRLKPKTKLFARPAAAFSSKRPTSAGQGRQKLPEGLRVRRGDSDRPKTAKSKVSAADKGARPSEEERKRSVSDVQRHSPTQPIGPVGERPNHSIPRKTVPASTNHVASLAQPSVTGLQPNESSVTVNLKDQTLEENDPVSYLSPEKQRLMKALRLRKQQRLDQAQKQEKSVDNILITARVDSQPPNPPQKKIDSGVSLDTNPLGANPVTPTNVPHLSIPPTSFEAATAESSDPNRPGSRKTFIIEAEPEFVRPESAGPDKPKLQKSFTIESEPVFSPASKESEEQDTNPQTSNSAQDGTMTLGRSVELAAGESGSHVGEPPLQPPPKSRKRLTATTPIKTDFSKDDDNASTDSDDSLFAELATARVEEATPISLTNSINHNSPVTAPNSSDSRAVAAIMIRPGSRQTGPAPQNGVSQPASRAQQIAEQRKVSPLVVDSSSTMLKKKTNVSSEIHKRIQRLAEHSSRESLPSSPPPHINSPVDKSMFYHMDHRPTTTQSQASFGHHRGGSRASSPTTITEGRLRMGGSEYGGSSRVRHQSTDERRRPDAVSITAHIVRDPQPGSDPYMNGIQPDFNRSKVVIEHQSTDPKHSMQNGRKGERRSSFSSRPGSRESSLTSLTRQSFEIGWKKLGRGRTDTTNPFAHKVRSVSKNSQDRASEKDKDKDKIHSKATRIFKRVSGLSKKSGAADNNGLNDDDLVREPLSPQGQIPHSKIIVGDLNVQLPDTLLWKWRWVEIDVFGNIVLSSSRSNEFSISRGVAKKYHLSDFEKPYIPSTDRQEIPNSIVLELISGGALQIACEDTIAQAQVFKRLLDTHRVWNTLRNRSNV